jgi:arginine repressor
MSATQDWIKEQYELERKIVGENVEYTNMRLSKELEELKGRIKQLETDMAYQTYATSPEEQRIYDLRKTD